jgi:hypothetical protein
VKAATASCWTLQRAAYSGIASIWPCSAAPSHWQGWRATGVRENREGKDRGGRIEGEGKDREGGVTERRWYCKCLILALAASLSLLHQVAYSRDMIRAKTTVSNDYKAFLALFHPSGSLHKNDITSYGEIVTSTTSRETIHTDEICKEDFDLNGRTSPRQPVHAPFA